MSVDHIDWKCEKCGESPDVLIRIREKNKRNIYITKYICVRCNL
jgi:hypothetical protein